MLEDTGSRPSRGRSRAIETLRKAYQRNCGSELADTWLIRRGRPTGSGRKQGEIAEKGEIKVMRWQLLSGHLSCHSPFMCLHFLIFSYFPSMGFSLIHMDQPRKSNEIHMYCVHLKQLISKVLNGVTAATTAPYGCFEATIGHLISLIQ